MRGTTWAALVAVLAIALGAAGCGSEQSPPEVKTVALLTPGKANDLDWTRLARSAFERLVDERHLSGSIADELAPSQVSAAMSQLSAEGAELVIAHDPRYARAAARAASRHDLPVLAWGDRGALRRDLVGDVEVAAADGGFVAGALSAEATGIKDVAVLIAEEGSPWEAETWNRMAGAFLAGARRQVPHVKASVEWVGGPDGAEPGDMQRAAERLLDGGTQTIFALGGRSAVGVLRAVNKTTGEQEYAGIVGDKATVNTLSAVVTSVLFDFEALFARAMRDLRTGNFGRKPYSLTFENGGLDLLMTGRTPSDAYDEALKVQAALANGTIEPPQTPTRADVRAVLASPPER